MVKKKSEIYETYSIYLPSWGREWEREREKASHDFKCEKIKAIKKVLQKGDVAGRKERKEEKKFPKEKEKERNIYLKNIFLQKRIFFIYIFKNGLWLWTEWINGVFKLKAWWVEWTWTSLAGDMKNIFVPSTVNDKLKIIYLMWKYDQSSREDFIHFLSINQTLWFEF